MSERLRKLFQFRIRDLLILIALFGGIGGWILMQHQEKRRELMIVDQVLGKRGMPSDDSFFEGGIHTTRFEDNQIPSWMSRRCTISAEYGGPAFLRYYVKYYFPYQPTIFYRIVEFEFNGLAVNEEKLSLLSQLSNLRTIKFYERSFENIDTIATILPGWKLKSLDSREQKFNEIWYRSFELHRDSN